MEGKLIHADVLRESSELLSSVSLISARGNRQMRHLPCFSVPPCPPWLPFFFLFRIYGSEVTAMKVTTRQTEARRWKTN